MLQIGLGNICRSIQKWLTQEQESPYQTFTNSHKSDIPRRKSLANSLLLDFKLRHYRRFTRLTNGFSKKVENHAYSVALYYMHYNFSKIHTTLRVTPAMEAGITDHVWTIEEMIDRVGVK